MVTREGNVGKAMPRLGPTAFASLIALAALVLPVLGCGDGEELPVEDRLQAFILQEEDLPPGFEATEALFTTNDDQADLASNPEELLANLDRWGRILGYELFFDPVEAADDEPFFSVYNFVSIYSSADGASQSLAYSTEENRARDWANEFQELSSFQIEEISRPGLADEHFWLRLSGLEGNPEDPIDLLIIDIIIFRQGKVGGGLGVTSVSLDPNDRDAFLDQVAALLQKQLDRIQ